MREEGQCSDSSRNFKGRRGRGEVPTDEKYDLTRKRSESSIVEDS